MMSLELLGIDELLGDDAPSGGMSNPYGAMIGPALQFGGGLLQAGLAAKDQSDKADKLAADEKSALEAANRADQAAAAALARSFTAAQGDSVSAKENAKTAADMAASAQDRAAAKLSAKGSSARADAVDKAYQDAVDAAAKSPKDAYKAALVKAWAQVANRVHNSDIKKNAPDDSADEGKGGKGKGGGKMVKIEGGDGESWLTGKVAVPVVGQVPRWGVGVGGAGIVAGGWMLVKKFLLHR